MPEVNGERAQEVRDALSFLESAMGSRALMELSYGDLVLARFAMGIEEAAAEDGLLTVIGDVRDLGEALLYSEINLPLSHKGVYEISVAMGQMRLSTDEGMRLQVTRLGGDS